MIHSQRDALKHLLNVVRVEDIDLGAVEACLDMQILENSLGINRVVLR